MPSESGDTNSGANNASPVNLLLFRFIWLNFSNSQCPLFSSNSQAIQRGANPDADWNANSSITLPDGRGVGLIGVDGMGGAATALLNGVPVAIGNTTTPGSIVGENLHALNSNEMPSHFHRAGISDPGHSHTYVSPQQQLIAGASNIQTPFVQQTQNTGVSATGVRVASNNGLDTTNSAGGNQLHNTVHRSMTVYWNLAQ